MNGNNSDPDLDTAGGWDKDVGCRRRGFAPGTRIKINLCGFYNERPKQYYKIIYRQCKLSFQYNNIDNLHLVLNVINLLIFIFLLEVT